MSQFSDRYDRTINDLEAKLSDAVDSGIELDFDKAGDVLTIEFEDGERFIISPNSPVEQLWVSANYQGHRFNWVDEKWQDEKGSEAFEKFLSDEVSKKLGSTVEF